VSGSRVSKSFRRQVEKRLRILEAATALRDLTQLRSNRVEAMAGDRKGQDSIRINQQWRICFEWPQMPTVLKTSKLSITIKESDHGAHPDSSR
jgi:proteic killer suppression protein